MSNLANRLRKFVQHRVFGPEVDALLREAADELDRLYALERKVSDMQLDALR